MTLYVVTAEIPDYWDGGTFGFEACGVFQSEADAEAYIASVKARVGSYEADHHYRVHETKMLRQERGIVPINPAHAGPRPAGNP